VVDKELGPARPARRVGQFDKGEIGIAAKVGGQIHCVHGAAQFEIAQSDVGAVNVSHGNCPINRIVIGGSVRE
jgi:hypothetical protein